MPDFDSLTKSVYRFPHEPTMAQIEAGNYPKRKVAWRGLTISIENEAGSVRRGVDRDGHEWETRMVFPYGYILGSLGSDSEHVDCYLGPDEDAPMVYIVNQRQAWNWEKYDEQKVLLGFRSRDEAIRAYLLHYDDPRFLGPVTAMPVDEFKDKVLAADGRMVKSSRDVPETDFGNMDFGQWMLKAEHGPIPAGAHWITVRPGGTGKGQPILVMPQSDGSMRVIGGAGGALNHLKLRSVKQGQSLKDAARQRQQERQEARKKQIEADKAAGIHEQKQAAKSALRESMKKQRQEFVKTVADLMGWDSKALEFDEDKHAGLSPEALAKARKEHEKDIFKRAREAVDVNRKKLLEDHDALAQSGLGEIPHQSRDAETISVADLDPLPEKKPGLGFAPEYSKRAADHGLTPDKVEAELAQVDGTAVKPTDPDAQAKAAEKKDVAAKIAQEVESFKLANPETVKPQPKVLEDAKKAAALVKAQKKLKMLEMQARQTSMDLANATVVESRAHVLEASDAEVEEAAKKQMEQDVKTLGAVGLLSEIDKMGGEESLGGHVGAGAFNALNAAAQAIAGDSIIDRSVVDVLGVNAAAQILARRIHKDFEAGDLDRIRLAVERHHIASQHDIQETATKDARALADAAASIELPDGKTGFDLAAAQAANHKRREAVQQAKRLLGQAAGQLQAQAALVMATKEGAKDSIEVSLGKTEAKAAITQLHALGLKPSDYKLEDVGGNLIVTLHGDGLDRMARPVDVEGLKQVQRNLAIIRGDHDEEGWLPKGFANRPDLAMHVEPGVAERLAQPFTPGPDLAQSLRDYIGGRAADGDAAADILADVQSAAFFQKAGDPAAYRAALEAVVPLRGEDGKMRPVESHADAFQAMADQYVEKLGGDRKPIHRQRFSVDQQSVDALHRALSETPEGVAAFKPIGDLTPQERTGIRKWFDANLAKVDEAGKAAQEALDAHDADEPTKESVDMFGETAITPEWSAWKAKRDELSEHVGQSGLDWNKYVSIHGSPEAAIKSVQDLVRSRVIKSFADTHNKLRPGSPIKLGRTVIAGNLHHLDAVAPAAREKRLAEQKALVDALRDRVQGKYASGSVADKIEAKKEEKAGFEQSQMGFFSTEDSGFPEDKPLAADERHTIGHAAEQQLAGMMSVVGQNFKPGQATKLWKASMDGKYIAQQRAIKLMEANKRIMLGYGAGSGKTGICLGATTHLIETGKIKRALHLVPSIVQDQYNGEALRYLEPGKYKWHCQPGASRAERIAAYKDPSNHFAVMTHESFRSDMIHMGAKHAGIPEKEMTERVGKMTPAERKDWAKATMDKEGIDFGAVFVDEAHQIVNRAGKENSARANVIDAVSDNTPYYAYSSGDPVKNDSSELHDVLSKLDRARYGDRAEFMRKYGTDTVAAKAALKRELARYGISNLIAPDVKADYQNVSVPVSDSQKAALKQIDAHVAKLKDGDLDAARALSPASFEGVPEGKHAEVAGALAKSAGMIRQAAIKRVLNAHPGENAKIDKMLELVEKHKGQPGVVFAHNREAVAQIVAALEAKGHKVATITGADSAKDKAKKKALFQPESGEPQANIMVMSDAGAVGMNLQRGQWLVQHDVPDTAMVHGQRSARIHRLGQKNNVSVYTLAADHPSEKRALDRLSKKYQLRELMLDPMDGLDDTGVAAHLKPKTHEAQASMF